MDGEIAVLQDDVEILACLDESLVLDDIRMLRSACQREIDGVVNVIR